MGRLIGLVLKASVIIMLVFAAVMAIENAFSSKWALLLLAAAAAWLLARTGVFKKAARCRHCGKTVPGPQQKTIGKDEDAFVLCGDCASKVHEQVLRSAGEDFTYQDYLDCLDWQDETAGERAAFSPEYSYGGPQWHGETLEVDEKHGLFRLGTKKKPGEVFRFEDLKEWDMGFIPETIKEGVMTRESEGTDYFAASLMKPAIVLKGCLRRKAVCKAERHDGVLQYILPERFKSIIDAFGRCANAALGPAGDIPTDGGRGNEQ